MRTLSACLTFALGALLTACTAAPAGAVTAAATSAHAVAVARDSLPAGSLVPEPGANSTLAPVAPAAASQDVTAQGVPDIRSPAQLRGYFVDAFGPGMYTPAQIDQLVADVKAAHMNAIFAEVVRRGDCLCNKASVPRMEGPIAPRPFDPLETLIEKAHAQGIQVHAWMMVQALWMGPALPTDPAHPFLLHGPTAGGRNDWVNRRADGIDHVDNSYYLDLGHPDAAAYVVDLVRSIVAGYDVDGINLDGIRYPDDNLGTNVPSWGYNATALARFRAETGRADIPAPTDPAWTQWRRDRVTEVVRRVYAEVTTMRPKVVVSADTITYGAAPQSQGGWASTRTYAEVLQDWVGWLREGILDLNIPMLYKRGDRADQRQQYIEWNEFVKEQQYGRQAAIGTALYLNDAAANLGQAKIAVAPGASGKSAIGWVGYSYRTPDAAVDAGTRGAADARSELAKALAGSDASLFRAPAVVPPMPWKLK